MKVHIDYGNKPHRIMFFIFLDCLMIGLTIAILGIMIHAFIPNKLIGFFAMIPVMYIIARFIIVNPISKVSMSDIYSKEEGS